MKIGTNTLLTTLNHVNIDAFYGPYTSEGEALRRLYNGSKDYRELGLTVGIYKFIEDEEGTYYLHRSRSNSYYDENIGDDPTTYSIAGITEYWFQWNDTKTDLVLSQKGILVKLMGIHFTAEADENNTVTVSYTPEGNSIFALNSVSIYRDNVLVTLNNFKEQGDTFSFEKVPEGSYIYKILIVDIFGLTVTEEQEVRVGTIKVTTEDLSNVTGLDLISAKNIEGKQFKVNIQILDPSWKSATYGIYADDTQISGLNFVSEDNGNKRTLTVNISLVIADAMDSHIIYVKATKGSKTYEFELFKVLSSTVLFVNLNETKSPVLYVNNMIPVKFLFTSGALLFYIEPGSDSDFLFNPLSITFNKFGRAEITLYITPLEIKNNAIIAFAYGDNKEVTLNLGNIVERPQLNRYVSWDTLPTNSHTNNCYIDFTGIITPNSESDTIITFNDKMWITNDVIHVGDIEVATPLNEKVYVGMGFGLQDINPNIPIGEGESGYYTYDCICINGTIVKISKKEGRTGGDLSWGSTTPSSNHLDIYNNGGTICTGYWTNERTLSLFNNGTALCETNYLSDGFSEESKILPTLYLEALESITGVNYDVWKSGFHNVSFGEISDGFVKYNTETIVGVPDAEFKLLKINEPNKKDYLKKYGVVCKYYYTETNQELPSNIAEIDLRFWSTGIVTVYTLGTSTLRYAIPNFKFYFAGENGFTIKYKEKTIGTNSVSESIKEISEKVLTAKADYMESSHLNNTPTAILYNEIVKSNIISEKSPSISLQGTYNDAIVGTPIKLMIKDKGKTSYNNFGSFMLNTDKTSDTLGFKVNGEDTCISFEGTSNFEDTGIASRFLSVTTATEGVEGEYLDLNTLNQVNGYTKEQITTFLSKGFEYRYPDEDIDSNMPSEHYDTFLNMWKFVAESDEETNFSEKFNLEYCYLYIIFMMVFGQTDNLGKNCMFDCWKTEGNWGKWFPRPYDLDSQCGLNNNGEEIIPPFVLVSLNWIPDDSLKSNPIFDANNVFKYKYMPTSKIFGYSSSSSKLWENIYLKYLADINSMYASLRSSYLSYDNLIAHFEDTIINKIPIHQYNIDFLNKYLGSPLLSYMLGNRWTNFKDWIKDRLAFCDGYFRYKNATYQLTTGQTLNVSHVFPAYLIVLSGGNSSYFFGLDIRNISIGGTAATLPDIYLSDALITSTNLYNNSAYTAVLNDNFEFINLKELTLGGSISPNLTKCKQLSKLIITETCLIKSFTIPSNVLELICNAEILTLTIDENSQLKSISLSNVKLNQLDLSNCSKLETLTLNSCEIDELILGPGEIDFTSNGCSFETITLDQYSVIKDLDLSNQSIHNLNLKGTINRLDLFKTNFTTTNLNDSVLPLDLTNVSGIEILNLIRCNIEEVRIGNNTFGSLLKLGVLDSSISKFSKVSGNSLTYEGIDLTILPNNVTSIINYVDDSMSSNPILNIYSLEYHPTTKEYYGKSTETSNLKLMEQLGVSFGKCNNITGAMVKSGTTNGCALFALCQNLEAVTSYDSSTATLSSYWVFYGCTSLNNLTRIKINKFRGAFVGTILPYSTVEGKIDKNSNDGDFRAFYCLVNPTNRLVSVNGNNYPKISKLDYMFSLSSNNLFLKLSGVDLDITITQPFTITTDCKSMIMMFDSSCIASGSNVNTDRYLTITNNNLFVKENENDASEYITDAYRAFRGCHMNNAISLLSKFTSLFRSMGMFANSVIEDNITEIILQNTRLCRLEGMFLNAKFNNNVKIDNFIRDVIGLGLSYHYTIETGSDYLGNTLMLDTCFFNCKNAYISEEFKINADITTVYVNGFLGLSSIASNSATTQIVFYDKFELKPFTGTKKIRVNDGTIGDSTYSLYCGSFSYRKTNSTNITLDCTNSNNKVLNYYLKGIYRENGNLTVSILNPKEIQGICEDAVNVDVTFSTDESNCLAISAFQHCTFVSGYNYNKINLHNISNASKMFAACNIEKIEFVLPDTITNVTSMFNSCKGLKYGLPSGFFDNATLITDVSRMFYKTGIVVKSNADIGRMSLLSLPSNITTAQLTFAAIDSSSYNSLYDITINNPVLTNMIGIFASMSTNITVSILSIGTGADMSYAFVNRESVPNNYMAWINSVNTNVGMFYNETPLDLSCANYKQSISTINEGMFYNWEDDNTQQGFSIDNSYKLQRRIEVALTANYEPTYII